MSELGSKWSPRRKLVVVVVAALAGITAWLFSSFLMGPEPGVELGRDQWSLVEQGEISVTIRFEEGGGCHQFKKAEVDESDVEVKVTMVVEYLVPGEGEACTEELRSRISGHEVELDRDLGGRELRVFRRELEVTR